MKYKQIISSVVLVSFGLSACNGGAGGITPPNLPTQAKVTNVNVAKDNISSKDNPLAPDDDISSPASDYRRDLFSLGDIIFFNRATANGDIVYLSSESGLHVWENATVPADIVADDKKFVEYFRANKDKLKVVGAYPKPNNYKAMYYDEGSRQIHWLAFSEQPDQTLVKKKASWQELAVDVSQNQLKPVVLQEHAYDYQELSYQKSLTFEDGLLSGTEKINVNVLRKDFIDADGQPVEGIVNETYLAMLNSDLKLATTNATTLATSDTKLSDKVAYIPSSYVNTGADKPISNSERDIINRITNGQEFNLEWAKQPSPSIAPILWDTLGVIGVMILFGGVAYGISKYKAKRRVQRIKELEEFATKDPIRVMEKVKDLSKKKAVENAGFEHENSLAKTTTDGLKNTDTIIENSASQVNEGHIKFKENNVDENGTIKVKFQGENAEKLLRSFGDKYKLKFKGMEINGDEATIFIQDKNVIPEIKTEIQEFNQKNIFNPDKNLNPIFRNQEFFDYKYGTKLSKIEDPSSIDVNSDATIVLDDPDKNGKRKYFMVRIGTKYPNKMLYLLKSKLSAADINVSYYSNSRPRLVIYLERDDGFRFINDPDDVYKTEEYKKYKRVVDEFNQEVRNDAMAVSDINKRDNSAINVLITSMVVGGIGLGAEVIHVLNIGCGGVTCNPMTIHSGNESGGTRYFLNEVIEREVRYTASGKMYDLREALVVSGLSCNQLAEKVGAQPEDGIYALDELKKPRVILDGNKNPCKLPANMDLNQFVTAVN